MDRERIEMLLDIGHLMYQIDEAEELGSSHIELNLQFLKEIVQMAIEGANNVSDEA